MIKSLLKSAGFSSEEADIYLFLRSLAPQTMTGIIYHTREPRSTCDRICKKLEKMGLVASKKSSGLNLWRPLPLEDYAHSQERKLRQAIGQQNSLKKAVNLLSKSAVHPHPEPVVICHNGFSGLREAHDTFFKAIKPGSIVHSLINLPCEWGADCLFAVRHGEDETRIKRSIKEVAICSLHEEVVETRKYQRKNKQRIIFRHNGLQAPYEMVIGPESVLEVVYMEKSMYSILTEHRPFRDLHKQFFDEALEKAEKEDMLLWDKKEKKLTLKGRKLLEGTLKNGS